ncbi:MAG TPA: hypothetical protein VMI33_12285 [Streptosporangiaceae bacterium]|nr:hypothetical protein [Streptosporangiaceae bacterium]
MAWPIVLVRAAVPTAKTAGIAARDGVRSAAAWATPRVNGARAWTAPRIERSGIAIKDTIAPQVCEMLAAAARWMEVSAPGDDGTAPRRRWPAVIAGTALLTAVGAAAAAVVLRRRKGDGTCEPPGETADEDTGPQLAQDDQPRPDAHAGDAETDASKPAPAS